MSPKDSADWVDTPMETTGDAIVASLAAGGVDHLFFTSGSEIGFYQEAIAKARANGHNKLVRLVTVPLEHISLNAALGFAAVSGRPAAVAAHVDCGTLHWGGAIHTAWRSGLPVIMTAGFPPTAAAGSMPGSRDEGGHLWVQETYDQNAIVRNYVKWEHQLSYQDDPGTITSRAIQVARTEPAGPVYMNIPKEISLLPLRSTRFPSADQLGIPRPLAPEAEAIEEIAEHLIKAEHPTVIVSGSGRNPRSVAPLVELCEMLGLAVIDSASKAYLSFPYTHPLHQAQSVLPDADAVLALDCEVPFVPTVNEPATGAYIAVVAQDSIKLRIPTYELTADVRLTADPLLTIRALIAAAKAKLSDDDKPRIAERTKRLHAASAARRQAAVEKVEAMANSDPIEPFWVSYQICKLLDDNCIVMDDTLGRSGLHDFLPCAEPGSYFRGPGSSGGWAPGAAFGAKLAAPDKDVVAITGDGFYIFGTPAPAIWAAKQHGAPYLTVVFTNRSYTTGTSALYRTFGPDSYAAAAGFEGGYFDPPIDFALEAEAAGGWGENVTDPAEVAGALKRGMEQVKSGTPAVVSIWLKRLEGDD